MHLNDNKDPAATLGDRAYGLLRGDIIRCVLPPGSEVSESKLAEQYGVGLAAVRKALSRLTQDGFVTPLPRRGYVITPITLRGIHDLLELRSVLEPAAARKAAASREDSPLRIGQADGPLEGSDSVGRLVFLQENREFHLSIMELAGNALATNVMLGVMDSLERVLHMGLFARSNHEEDLARERALQRLQHEELRQAIIAREADLAERIAREHIAHTRKLVLEAVTENRIGVHLT